MALTSAHSPHPPAALCPQPCCLCTPRRTAHFNLIPPGCPAHRPADAAVPLSPVSRPSPPPERMANAEASVTAQIRRGGQLHVWLGSGSRSGSGSKLDVWSHPRSTPLCFPHRQGWAMGNAPPCIQHFPFPVPRVGFQRGTPSVLAREQRTLAGAVWCAQSVPQRSVRFGLRTRRGRSVSVGYQGRSLPVQPATCPASPKGENDGQSFLVGSWGNPRCSPW